MPHKDIYDSINRWLQGDDTVFEAVFYYYRPKLLRYAFRFLKNETEAEDLVTEVLVKIWQHKLSVTSVSTFENYLFTIARNLLIKAWQKKVDSLLSLETSGQIADLAGANDAVLYKDLEQHYQESLAGLPEKRRRIFLLHREQNLSYKEIAQYLNISPRTVENQIAATLKQLRSQLAHYLTSFIL